MVRARGILLLTALLLGLAAAPAGVLEALPTDYDERAQERLRDGIGDVTDWVDETASAARDAAADRRAKRDAASVENRTPRERRLERLIHERVNQRRQRHGLGNLSWNGDLATVARYHSTQMAEKRYFAHTAPSGESLADRYEAFGVACAGGENLGYVRYGGGTYSDEELARRIVTGWMNSEGHRKNLLRPRFDAEGIGVTVVERDGQTHVYATQNFC
jgi:uncharacterized protein YkwD